MRTFTKNFDTYIARVFFEEFINDPSNHYYMFAAKSTPHTTAPDIPTIGKSVTSSFYDIYRDIIFGKKLTNDDISYMVKKTIWQSNVVYDAYDDADDDLYSKNFMVFTEEGDSYSLFKCISNNYGALTVDKPVFSRTSFADDYFQTGDGYVWKLITSISSSVFSKFETDNWAPLETDTTVVDYARPGSIDYIKVESEGSNYNSFAYGTIKSTSYNNNARKITLQTDTERDIYEMPIVPIQGSFTPNAQTYLWSFPATATSIEIATALAIQDYSESGIANNPDVDALGTVYTFDPSDPTLVRIARDENFSISYSDFSAQGSGSNIFIVSQGSTPGPYTAAIVTGLQIILVPELSANNSFYVDSSIYIRGGSGSGQLKTITGYDIIGNDRVITVDSNFSSPVDSTSKFEISPRVSIQGDGTGAKAIVASTLQGGSSAATYGIRQVEMVDSGEGYSFADVEIIGNTGIIDTETGIPVTANTAVSRAIISPKGGHGSDIINETYASAIGFSANFFGTEHPNVNDYNTYGILVNPKFVGTDYYIDIDSGDTTDVTSELTTSNNNSIITQESTGASAVAYNLNGTELYITDIQGNFEATQSGDATTTISVGGLDGVTIDTGLSISNKFDNRTTLTVTAGLVFGEDEKVVSTGGATGYVHYHTSNGTTMYLTGVKGIFQPGDTITSEDSGKTALINSITESDIKQNSGEILYIETTQTIERSVSQNERLKIVTNF